MLLNFFFKNHGTPEAPFIWVQRMLRPTREGRRVIQVLLRRLRQPNSSSNSNPLIASTCTTGRRPKHCWQVAMIAGIEMACDVKLKSILGAARSKVNDATEASLVASTNNTRSLC